MNRLTKTIATLAALLLLAAAVLALDGATAGADPTPPAPEKIVRIWSDWYERNVVQRDEDGRIVTEARDNPELTCEGYYYVDGEWLCDGLEYSLVVFPDRQWTPDNVCTNYERRHHQGHPRYQTSVRCTAQEPAPIPSAPAPVGGPAPPVTTIVHTSNPSYPACTAEQEQQRARGAFVFCE